MSKKIQSGASHTWTIKFRLDNDESPYAAIIASYGILDKLSRQAKRIENKLLKTTPKSSGEVCHCLDILKSDSEEIAGYIEIIMDDEES
jgi:hypothetical protein